MQVRTGSLASTRTVQYGTCCTARVPESILPGTLLSGKSKGFMRDWMRRLWISKTDVPVPVCTCALRTRGKCVFRLLSANGNETMAGGIPVDIRCGSVGNRLLNTL